jgi:mRNA interferase MazF
MDFDPQQGREQSGHRPGLVISAERYNRCGLMLVCPITSKRKGYRFEIPVRVGKIDGCVLADHVKNQDWRGRSAAFAARAPGETVKNVLRVIALMLVDD